MVVGHTAVEVKSVSNIHWLPDDKYKKAEGQLRLQVGEILSVFGIYGMQDYIPGAIEEIVEVAIDFSKRVRGADHPIELKNRRNPRK